MSFVFRADLTKPPLEGILRYVEADYAFDFDVLSPMQMFDRSPNGAVTSLVIGTLQIEMSVSSGVALFVWGFFPRRGWEDLAFPIPHAHPGSIELLDPSVLEPGVSLSIAEDVWPTFYNHATGWVRVSDNETPKEDERIMISSGTIIGLHQHCVSSVYLQPIFE